MQVVVSGHSLQSIRHRISVLLPSAKSSHVAESLASGLGFRTNASLLAWLGEQPLSSIARRTLDAGTGGDRLARFGIEGGAAAIAEAALPAACRVDDYDRLVSDANAAVTEVGWPSVPPREQLAFLCFLLNWRMTASPAGAGGFIEYVSGAASPSAPLVIAACAEASRDFDRPIADFLTAFMTSAAAGSSSAVEWGDLVYRAHVPRIRSFLGAMCLTWEGPLPQRPARDGDFGRTSVSVTLVAGRSARPGDIGLLDTGWERVDLDSLAGCTALALARTGQSVGAAAARVEEALADGWRGLVGLYGGHARLSPAALLQIEADLAPHPVLGEGNVAAVIWHDGADRSEVDAASEGLDASGETLSCPDEGADPVEVERVLSQLRALARADAGLNVDAAGKKVHPFVFSWLAEAVQAGVPLVIGRPHPLDQAALMQPGFVGSARVVELGETSARRIGPS